MNANINIPNALSFARLLGVPLFFWLIVGPHKDGLALGILIVSAFTDWLDGFLARRLNQHTRLGELLDPAADRLYIAASLVALCMRHIIPLWVAIALISRDLVMAVVLAGLKRHGITGVPVHFIGKSATMNLLYALPLVLLGTFQNQIGHVAHIFGWAFLVWGICMYWYGAFLYIQQIRDLKIKLFA
ncbi:MAG: CDP-alcohol phosphatidyltransferase family protein [Actinomycetes bacterium]